MAAASRLFNGGLTSKVAKADAKSDSGPPSPVVGMRKAVSGGLRMPSAESRAKWCCAPGCSVAGAGTQRYRPQLVAMCLF